MKPVRWFSLLLALSAAALLSACAALPELLDKKKAPAPAPVASKPRPKIVETVILLPGKDGKSSGAVEITVDGQTQVLDQPYQTAMIATGEKIETRFSNAEEVKSIIGDAIQALPATPASFTLLFDLDSDRLPADADATVKKIIAEIAKRQVPDVSVIGHTDRSGNAKLNFALSQRRAENVYRLIVAKGGKAENVKIEVVGKGDSESAVLNLKSKFEQRNRRVEVFVR